MLRLLHLTSSKSRIQCDDDREAGSERLRLSPQTYCVYTASSLLRSSSQGPPLFDTRHRVAFTTPPKASSSRHQRELVGGWGERGRGGGALLRWEPICTVIDGIPVPALHFKAARPAGPSSLPSCLLTSEGSDVTMKWGKRVRAL